MVVGGGEGRISRKWERRKGRADSSPSSLDTSCRDSEAREELAPYHLLS